MVRANGKVEHLEATALPVGVFASWKCDEKSVTLAPGDVVIAFSDGVLEAGVERGEEFGETRLIAALLAARSGELEALLDSVIGEVLRFSPEVQSDDVTLIALLCRHATRAACSTVKREMLEAGRGARDRVKPCDLY